MKNVLRVENKKLLLRFSQLFLGSLICISTLNATTYTTVGINTWDANGVPPNPLPSGDIVNINHLNTLYDFGFTVTLQTGSALNVNSGGLASITNLVVDANASVVVASGGLLQTTGFITNNSNSFVIDGSLTDNSTFTNNGAITGTGTIDVGGTAGGTGTINGEDMGDIDFSSEVDLNDPLPVELLSFHVASTQAGVQADWVTISELNNHYFTVEKSSNGDTWVEAGTIQGQGNSSNENQYSFLDVHPFMGRSYYRLKQTDFDGKYEHFESRLVNIEFLPKNGLRVYPNPSSNVLFIDENKTVLRNLRVFDALGGDLTKKIKVQEVGHGKSMLNLTALAAGCYIVRLGSESTKVCLQ